jgi:hypothetical protein
MLPSITKQPLYNNSCHCVNRIDYSIDSSFIGNIYAIGLPVKTPLFLILFIYRQLSELYKKLETTSALYETLR